VPERRWAKISSDRTSRDQEIDVSSPGTGPQPPEQDPGQPGQPAGWGQQPPAGQPYPGQQPAAGQPYPGQQPWGPPQGATGAQTFGQPVQPQQKRNKWLGIIAGVVALIVVLTLVNTFLGGDSAKAGDCVNDKSSEIGVVDCDSDEAAYQVAGVVDDVSQNQLNDDQTVCTDDWPNAVAWAWEGAEPDDLDSKGTGYCLADLAS
jgi:hypothetical protein